MKVIFLFSILFLSANLKGQGELNIWSGTQLVAGSNTQLVFNNTDFINEGTYQQGTSVLRFTGSMNSLLDIGSAEVYDLTIAKSGSKYVSLSGDLEINNDLRFSVNNSFLQLNNFDLTLQSSSNIIGYDDNNFIVTNSNGQVIWKQMNAETFPIGYSTSTYNPLALNQFGAVDDIAVRCLSNVLTNGSSGSTLNDVVNASWEVTEALAGGSSMSMTASWKTTDELGSFDRTDCAIAHYGANGWDLNLSDLGSAGGGPTIYSRSRAAVTELGYFAVGGDPLLHNLSLGIDLLLEGAYDSGGLMTDLLRSGGYLSTTEPFTSLGFTHFGRGGSETVNASVFNTTGNNAIVDWVFVELRSGVGSGSKVATKSALLQKDGDVVDLDGSSNLKIPGFGAGNYYVVVKHRNHLGLMTANTVALSTSLSTIDFTSSASSAIGGALSLRDLGGGYYGLYSGDFDLNGQIQNTDFNSMILTIGLSGYQQGDLDLNGQVQNSELQSILVPNIGKGTQFDY